MTRRELVQAIAGAIAAQEGFTKVGSVAVRNHNPGNLRSWGQLPTDKGYVVFPDDEAGWRALRSQVDKNINRRLTLLTFFGGQRDETGRVISGGYPGFSPAADSNNPKRYAEFVATRVGIPVDTILSTIAPT